jgi:DNA-binding MltR family transcriptional regulator
MKSNVKDAGIKIDRTLVEKMADTFYELGVRDINTLIAFSASLHSKMHDISKNKLGGDSPYSPSNVAYNVQILLKESDRGCALVAAAFLEEELAILLRGYFIDDDKCIKNMFGPFGVLDSFSSKILMAYCLGLISKKAKTDLELIKRIRNKYAHNAKAVSFNDADIILLCNKLHHDVYLEISTPKMKFIRVVNGVALEIHLEMASSKRRMIKNDTNIENFFTKKQRDMILEIIDKHISKKLSAENGSET